MIKSCPATGARGLGTVQLWSGPGALARARWRLDPGGGEQGIESGQPKAQQAGIGLRAAGSASSGPEVQVGVATSLGGPGQAAVAEGKRSPDPGVELSLRGRSKGLALGHKWPQEHRVRQSAWKGTSSVSKEIVYCCQEAQGPPKQRVHGPLCMWELHRQSLSPLKGEHTEPDMPWLLGARGQAVPRDPSIQLPFPAP